MPHINYQICVEQIRGILRLPPQACCSDIVAKVKAAHETITATPTSKDNACYVLHQIRIVLELPAETLPDQILAKVRETKAAADLAGAALVAREHFTPDRDEDDDLPIGHRRDITGTRDQRIP